MDSVIFVEYLMLAQEYPIYRVYSRLHSSSWILNARRRFAGNGHLIYIYIHL